MLYYDYRHIFAVSEMKSPKFTGRPDVKTNADHFTLDSSGPFDGLNENDNLLAKLLAEALRQHKEALVNQTISNLVDSGISRESEKDLEQWLMTFDLSTLTMWLLQSRVLRELESKRLGLE